MVIRSSTDKSTLNVLQGGFERRDRCVRQLDEMGQSEHGKKSTTLMLAR